MATRPDFKGSLDIGTMVADKRCRAEWAVVLCSILKVTVTAPLCVFGSDPLIPAAARGRCTDSRNHEKSWHCSEHSESELHLELDHSWGGFDKVA